MCVVSFPTFFSNCDIKMEISQSISCHWFLLCPLKTSENLRLTNFYQIYISSIFQSIANGEHSQKLFTNP